jgi:hypothetical protein
MEVGRNQRADGWEVCRQRSPFVCGFEEFLRGTGEVAVVEARGEEEDELGGEGWFCGRRGEVESPDGTAEELSFYCTDPRGVKCLEKRCD